MIVNIQKISENPITAMAEMEEKEARRQMLLSKEEKEYNENKVDKRDSKDGRSSSKDKRIEAKTSWCKRKKVHEAPMETILLEKTIAKIGALLALGFGEAGSEIIAKNMKSGSDGDVNPMIPGKKVMAAYGFCDIRKFTDTTEVLQENVMIFVNEVAEIVHDICAEYGGSANKNIGDAFLLVWKFEDKYTTRDANNNIDLVTDDIAVSQFIDMATIAVVKMLIKIQKDFKMDKYRKHELLNKRMPGYEVKMGFGLHVGYSIEGAIGSSFKIDASYLSPHANMANKLEEQTKEHGTPLIISEFLVEKMTPEARAYTRRIDKIKLGEQEKEFSIKLN